MKLRKAQSERLAPDIADWIIRTVWESRDLFPSCVTCRAFTASHYWCGKFNCYPSPQVIRDGCEGYDDQDEPPLE